MADKDKDTQKNRSRMTRSHKRTINQRTKSRGKMMIGSSHKRNTKRITELMSKKFLGIMTDNMWQYMNKDTIKYVLKHTGCKVKYHTIKDINNDNYSRKHYNSIVFQGDSMNGHYVYVDSTGNVFGTYECNILYKKDDGVCHGFALAAALKKCGKTDIGDIYTNPTSDMDRIQNYITIMKTYKFIIEYGNWEDAVYEHFFNDFVQKNKSEDEMTEIVVHEIKIRTTQALHALDEILSSLENRLKKMTK